MIQELIREDAFPEGRNKRQQAIAEAYPKIHPGCTVPKRTTIFGHLKKLKTEVNQAVMEANAHETI